MIAFAISIGSGVSLFSLRIASEYALLARLMIVFEKSNTEGEGKIVK